MAQILTDTLISRPPVLTEVRAPSHTRLGTDDATESPRYSNEILHATLEDPDTNEEQIVSPSLAWDQVDKSPVKED